MNQILEALVLLFAMVGLIACGRWIYRSGWGNLWKVVGALAVVSLWWAMVNGPLSGRWGADHGVLTDLFASFGIAIVATWGVRRVGNDWRRQAAVVVGALALMAMMWIPRYQAGHLALPITVQPSVPTIRSVPATAQHPSVTADTLDCDELSYDGKIAAGCP
ncbi:hypothetical protein FJZ23_01830 [Candidatus Parcubacteria bacterium]|nr:hypothetical protein [Candidatus Parcubacteria bacterium]